MSSYRPTSFWCGSCGRKLDFMHRTFPIPGAWYVHADTHRFRCHRGLRSTDTNTADLSHAPTLDESKESE